jgi:hypothetical protein
MKIADKLALVKQKKDHIERGAKTWFRMLFFSAAGIGALKF